MIISKTIKVRTAYNNQTKYYKDIGYDISLDFLDIPIDILNVGSRYSVEAICDYCQNIVNVQYHKYIASISKGTRLFACSKQCAAIKRKETNLEKYGVEIPIQSEEIKNKIDKTNLEKYGYENASKSKIVIDKIKSTNLGRYGVENTFQSEIFKEKIRDTNLKNLGYEYPTQSDLVKKKIKETNLEKCGSEWYFSSDFFKENSKEKCLEKYGVEFYPQSDIVKKKVKETNIKRYGTDSIEKNNIYRLKYNMCNNPNYNKYIGGKISEFKCDCNEEHIFNISTSMFFNRISSNTPLCTVCYPIGDNSSIKEKELLKFIKSIYDGEIIDGHRDELEIDIYLPDLKIGFEFNGLYFHSSKFRDRNYHLNKTNHFKEKGIRIIHIWEDDWDFRSNIIKSQISNIFGKSNKIYARKCQIKEIKDPKIVRKFLNDSHIQGYIPSSLKIGLYYNDKLMSLVTFDHFEGRKKIPENEWNLSRFCNLINTNVIGGASKLLSYFIKNYNPTRIISYADKSWSNGNLYYKLGFNLVSESKVDYKYVINGERKHKQSYKKQNLIKMGCDTLLTENKIMESLNYNRIYNCGQLKFEKI